ncbi:hypothetical protein AB0H82_33895 [Streptomyces sp. NPDC050732]|uniref:hypothetical protein n=1 Tax=Streptomyces sp. NPDC050732 TaxID=3154632 RepID=UPI003440DCCD
MSGQGHHRARPQPGRDRDLVAAFMGVIGVACTVAGVVLLGAAAETELNGQAPVPALSEPDADAMARPSAP